MTSPDVAAVVAELRALLEKATPQNLDTAEITEEGEYDCPLCETQGCVNGRTYTNYADVAQGVQFFGVGPEFKASEALFRAVTKHLPALLDSLDRQGDGGWRDISTAPKNGTNILGGVSNVPRSVGEMFWWENGWRTWDGENHTRTIMYPTHWKPLPAPPEMDASPPSEPVPVLLSHIEQGREKALEESLREANEAILELQRDLCRATGGTMPSDRAALSTQGEKKEEGR